ncbi:MAG TPA: hypothetical protein VGP47_03985 [Parachlamydiaceae bacterium]|nr:hypothetical protein [Parachlamydiaceae bacterium]
MATRKYKQDINEMLLEAHKKGIAQAIDLSIRTGIPLVVEKDGKIREVKPKYKYIRVAIKTDKVERHKK